MADQPSTPPPPPDVPSERQARPAVLWGALAAAAAVVVALVVVGVTVDDGDGAEQTLAPTLESVPADRDQARDLAEVADAKLADVLAGV